MADSIGVLKISVMALAAGVYFGYSFGEKAGRTHCQNHVGPTSAITLTDFPGQTQISSMAKRPATESKLKRERHFVCDELHAQNLSWIGTR